MFLNGVRKQEGLQLKTRVVEDPPIPKKISSLKSNSSYSLKGKGRLLEDAGPAAVEGVLKTILTAAVVLGIVIVSLPLLIPILGVGILMCIILTPFIMITEHNNKNLKSK